MKRLVLTLVLAGVAMPAMAHFVFIVPDPADPAKALVVFSEDLAADEGVSIDKIAGMTVTVRGAGGSLAATATKADHSLKLALPGRGPRVLYGSVDYGVLARPNSKPAMLKYHAKAVIGSPTDATLGVAVPLEIVTERSGDGVRFRALSNGKPVANAEGSIVRPGGESAKVKADAEGFTPVESKPGRYGIWVRRVEPTPGVHAGAKYKEIRHYATLVVDVAGK